MRSFATTDILVKDTMKCGFYLFIFNTIVAAQANPLWFCRCNYASKTVLLMIWLIPLTGGQNVVKPCWQKLAFFSLNCVCSKGSLTSFSFSASASASFSSHSSPLLPLHPPMHTVFGIQFCMLADTSIRLKVAKGDLLISSLLHFHWWWCWLVWLPSANSESCSGR